MSNKLAQALLLHDMLGCPLSETAALTGVSVVAAQSRVSRGRKELSNRLRLDSESEKKLLGGAP
jgi:DNA-directed RNA polymerase specialized sigma24 family protein